ncbi:hypothetical protein K490DRAFT_64587 [Saccharata proteae CBS 121410]|uniref:Hepatocellular carcinoma-associated antigen 59-domain-containing protein n=1 Tax=Saccharata proteae CBS 121410 TaxID=1314787 RepID=A0A9P4HZ58_9PEZI|nr:hypothetical protein K490DRAFT_64587 [Saccharata proteae CBS 121410]
MDSGEKVVFKRRKVTNLRKRHASDSDNEQRPSDLTTSAPAPTTTPSNAAAPDLSSQKDSSQPEQALNREKLQELRNRRRQPPKGISHSIEVSSLNRKRRAAPEPAEPTGPPTREDMSEAVVSGRFVKQTGLIVNDTRDHMNAYIDTKLREMRGYVSQQQRQQQIDDAAADDSDTQQQAQSHSLSTTDHHHATDDRPQKARQNALSGKIEEIDLGPQVVRDNIARTAAAANRLTGSASHLEDSTPPTTTTGQRRRNQKTADQLEREKLVDMILGERSSGQHMRYDGNPNDSNSVDADGGAEHDDDALAEKFVRAWEEQAQGRVRRHHPPPPAKTTGPRGSRQEAEKQSRGPKLGGSRSARAAVRAQEEAAQKGKLRR